MTDIDIGATVVVDTGGVQSLIDALIALGYQVLGPAVHDGAIVYAPIAHTSELPAGWTDRQEAGHYRLEKRADGAWFGYAVGPQSWKKFLHPPVERLWQARLTGGTFVVDQERPAAQMAFLGVRACELHAIAIQDKVFMGGAHTDAAYADRRRDNFIVALNCGVAGGPAFACPWAPVRRRSAASISR